MDKKPQLIEKEQQVAELQQLFEQNSAVVLADYRGISVTKDVELRARLRKADVKYFVAKNTLIRLAANNLNNSSLDAYLEGPTAIAFSADPTAAAKVIGDFIKENKVMSFKAGLLDGKFLDAAAVDALAKLPPREILLAQIAGCFAAPMSALARVVNMVKEAKEAQGDAPAAVEEAPVVAEAAPAEEAPAEAPAEETAPAEEAAPAEETPAAE